MPVKKLPLIYGGLISVTLFILVYFVLTQQARGDEGGAYLPSFEQAYSLWPALDLSPYWSISSFYLWVVASLQAIIGDFAGAQFLLLGRILSLFCWLGLVLFHLRSTSYKALAVLFNPYVLIYSVRAHPFLPGILLFSIFWTLTRQNKKIGLLFLPIAVNFQVFIGGAIGLFMPRLPLQGKEVSRVIILGLLAVSGVLITWLTWGGMYPPKFVNHVFFKEYHVNGKPSFGYLGTVLMLAGSTLWLVGNRTIADIREHKTYSCTVIASLLLAAIALYFIADIIAIAREASQRVFGAYYQAGWVISYVVIGFGWLRLHRDHYSLFFGLLGAAVLLVTLPYLYERISVFATVAPCLAWCSLQKNETQQEALILVMCCLFVLCSIAYQLYGSL
ncbi:hypothetical protein GCM10028808_22310 [Spirosoma migulaei]